MTPLKAYLSQRQISIAQFGVRVGVNNRSTMQRYVEGRLPPPDVMAAIVRETKGEIMPNDFYPIFAEQKTAQ